MTVRIPARVLLFPLIFVFFAGVWALRRPDAFTNPQLWAEDLDFLIRAEDGYFASLFQPMAGYLHLLLRCIALSGVYLDPAIQPAWYLAACLFFTSLVGNTCLSKRNTMACRYLLPVAIAVIPHTGEVPLTLTNLQWITALGLLVTSLKEDPSTVMHWISDCFFVVMVGLTGPFALFVVPIFIYRAYIRRSISSYVLLALAVGVSMVQLWFVYFTLVKPDAPAAMDVFKTFALVSKRLFGTAFLGSASYGLGPLTSAVLGACVIAYLAAAIRTLKDSRATYFLLLYFMLAIVFVSAVTKRFDTWYFLDIQNGDRYFFVPMVVLIWIMIGIIARGTRLWVYLPGMVLVAAGVVLNIGTFRFAPYKDDRWYDACPGIRRFEEVKVDINPGWTAQYRRKAPILLPCPIQPPAQ